MFYRRLYPTFLANSVYWCRIEKDNLFYLFQIKRSKGRNVNSKWKLRSIWSDFNLYIKFKFIYNFKKKTVPLIKKTGKLPLRKCCCLQILSYFLLYNPSSTFSEVISGGKNWKLSSSRATDFLRCNKMAWEIPGYLSDLSKKVKHFYYITARNRKFTKLYNEPERCVKLYTKLYPVLPELRKMAKQTCK